MPYIDTILRVIGTVALCYIAGMLSEGVIRMGTLKEAIDDLKVVIDKTLNKAIELIRNPKVDNEEAIAELVALKDRVAGTDLTPDNPDD